MLSPEQYALHFKKISDEVISHLAATPGVQLNARIKIEATAAGRFDDAQVRTVSENATRLTFEQSGFEQE